MSLELNQLVSYTLKTVLTEMFHCEIDLVRFRSSLPPFLKQNIEKEAIYV